MSDSPHPWAHLPALVEAGILSADEARDKVILAHESAHRRAFRELQALVPEMLARGEIEPKGVERIQRVIVAAQGAELPDS